MKNSYDLEQEIMSCWNVVDDLELLYDNIVNNTSCKFDMPADTEHRLGNIVLGLKELYQMRFERTHSTFEQVVFPNLAKIKLKNNDIDKPVWPDIHAMNQQPNIMNVEEKQRRREQAQASRNG